MKTAQDIISHITKKPQHNKLIQKECINKIISALPSVLSNAILFTYVKNRTLFFVLNHPGLKMEFNYKHNLIKSLLKKIKDIDPNCSNLDIKEIKSFVSNKIEKDENSRKKIYFKEKSKGIFENHASTKELNLIFEKIRKEIQKNR